MTNLEQLMQMGQQLQARMTKLQESLDKQTVTATSGGGMVTVTADGKGEVRQVKIDPACVDPRDVEMLEDLVLAAVNQAQARAKELYESEMRKATGGLPMQLPGLF
jgi:DNA-binding YbaB/EbfC family protein